MPALQTINQMLKKISLPVLAAFGCLLSACYYDKADKLYAAPVSCDTTAMTFNKNIAPILNMNCLLCHNTSNASGSVILDSYSGTTDAVQGSRLLNSVKHVSGGTPNMPPGSKLPDCDIQKIEAWITRGYPQ